MTIESKESKKGPGSGDSFLDLFIGKKVVIRAGGKPYEGLLTGFNDKELALKMGSPDNEKVVLISRNHYATLQEAKP